MKGTSMTEEIVELGAGSWSAKSTGEKTIRVLIVVVVVAGAFLLFGGDILATWAVTGKPFTFTPPPGWIENEAVHELASKAGIMTVWQYGPAPMVEEARKTGAGLGQNITITLYQESSRLGSPQQTMALSVQEKKRQFSAMGNQAGVELDIEQKEIAPYVQVPGFSVLAQELVVRMPNQSFLNITHIFSHEDTTLRVIVDYMGLEEGFEAFENDLANSLLSMDL